LGGERFRATGGKPRQIERNAALSLAQIAAWGESRPASVSSAVPRAVSVGWPNLRCHASCLNNGLSSKHALYCPHSLPGFCYLHQEQHR
jgi:hypothetical protein